MPPFILFEYRMHYHNGDFIAKVETDGILETGDQIGFNGTLLKVIECDNNHNYITVEEVGSYTTVRLRKDEV